MNLSFSKIFAHSSCPGRPCLNVQEDLCGRVESTFMLSPLSKSSTDPTSPVYTKDVLLEYCRGQVVSTSVAQRFHQARILLASMVAVPGWFRTGKDAESVVGRIDQSLSYVHVPSLRVSTVSSRVTRLGPTVSNLHRGRTSRRLCCCHRRCALSLVVTPIHHVCVPTQASTRSRTSPPALDA